MERCVLALLGEWSSHDDDDNGNDDDDSGNGEDDNDDDSGVHGDDDGDNDDTDVEDGVVMINQLMLPICDHVLMASFRNSKFRVGGKEEWHL